MTIGCTPPELFKFVRKSKGYEGFDESSFFKRLESVTRGHSLKLHKMRVNRPTCFKFSLGHRVIRRVDYFKKKYNFILRLHLLHLRHSDSIAIPKLVYCTRLSKIMYRPSLLVRNIRFA